MTQSRKLLGALGIVFGLAVLTFAITAGSTHQAFGQQTSTPSSGGTTAAGTGTSASGTGTSVSGTPATSGTSITSTGTRTAVAGSPTSGAAAGSATLPSTGTGSSDSGSGPVIWMIAAGALLALFGAGVLATGVRRRS